MESNWELVGSKSLRKFRVVDVRENTWRLTETGDERDYVVCDSADWVLVIPVTPAEEVVFVDLVVVPVLDKAGEFEIPVCQ